jgi:uncharacterized phage infection (PIP) family protein YhgE
MNIFKRSITDTEESLAKLQESFDSLNEQFEKITEELKLANEMSNTYKEEFERVEQENTQLNEQLQTLNQENAEVVQEIVQVMNLLLLKPLKFLPNAHIPKSNLWKKLKSKLNLTLINLRICLVRIYTTFIMLTKQKFSKL